MKFETLRIVLLFGLLLAALPGCTDPIDDDDSTGDDDTVGDDDDTVGDDDDSTGDDDSAQGQDDDDSAPEPPVDGDGDGYPQEEDCDDENEAIHPDADELCDGVDNNCDGILDQEDADDAATWYLDEDGDGYGIDSDTELACSQPHGYSAYDGDCDDSDAAFHPGATENDCSDPADYNCDGSNGYTDADTDGVAACEDCDDSDATLSVASEELCDSIDNDCDGSIDNDATDGSTWFGDADSDGYGGILFQQTACSAPSGYVGNSNDCDDLDPNSYPGAVEICDLSDNNCDNVVDEGVELTWYADTDADGYGDAGSTASACNVPTGFVSNALDCDDGSATTNPSAWEICDTHDNDCDNSIDEADAINAATWYVDGDNDGYGSSQSSINSCDAPTGYSDNSSDCADADPLINPAATETCNNVDDDCDGQTDEDAANASTWYPDSDTDTFGDPAGAVVACSNPGTSVTNDGDCNDSEPLINPNADEICNNADDDCNGAIDDDPSDGTTWYADADGDSYGDPNDSVIACSVPSGAVSNSGDCDDTPVIGANINPGTAEDCTDGIDNNCSGEIDDSYGEVSGGAACAGSHCQDILTTRTDSLTDGTYLIDPTGTGQASEVTCDMSTSGGGWTEITGAFLNTQGLVTFSQPIGSGNGNGWADSDTFDLDGQSGGDETLRADAVLPFAFSELFGSWTVPAESGHHADDNQSTNSWGGGASSCNGWLLFGTPGTVLKTGGQWGGDFNSSTNHTWVQPLTTVGSTTTLRWENNQECAWPDESTRVGSISLFVR